VAALFLNLIPVFGGALLVLGERLALAQWAGALLILVAVAGVLWLQPRETVPVSNAVATGCHTMWIIYALTAAALTSFLPIITKRILIHAQVAVVA